MNLAVVEPGLYASAPDRALGEAGEVLRESIAIAMSPSLDRGDEIYARVSSALRRAEQQDGVLIRPEAFGRTLELLSVLPQEIPLPEVVVESESEVGLDWDEGAGRVVSLTVRDTPMVGFAALLGAEPLHGRVSFAGEIPETLRFLLGRLFRGCRRE